tara:strand:- start:24741 stop:25214 length:474 start_codon:yes stop_codon:yes gene_type:complete
LSAIAGLFALAACGAVRPEASGGDGDATGPNPISARDRTAYADNGKIWDIFTQTDDGTKVAVNRYLWNASLEVLDFLPIQSVDPFTGVISTGYGTPPGGGRSYRATVYISDPALEARSLNVALETSGGQAVAAGTQRAVEDAILTRARQLRVADRKF